MSARKAPRVAPVDIFLHALRRWKSEAYTCAPEVGRWRADCPNCGGHRTVRICEHGDGGPIAVWCLQGRCTQDQIVEALKAVLTEHDCPEAQHWRGIAIDAIDLLNKQMTLADNLLGEIVDIEMRRAA